MTKPIIALDIDDVIASSTEALREQVNRRYKQSLKIEDYTSLEADYWGYYERVWEAHGLQGIKYNDLQSDMMIDQSHVPLLPGASFAIAQISSKYHIALVTARDRTWENATLDWLKLHFGDVFVGVHFAGNKYDGDITKGELCKDVGASLLIDDNIDHCKSALDAGLETILFGNYGWHKGRDKEGIVHCQDWPAVLEFLDGRA